MKKCRDCGIDKENDCFYKKSCNLDGLYSYCKECTGIQQKIYHSKNKESRNDASREYHEKNRDRLRTQSLEYYYKNRDSVLKKVRKYRQSNKKKISEKESLKRLRDLDRFPKNRERHKKWSDKNRDKLNAWQKEWYRRNKEKRRAHVVLHRAILDGSVVRPEKCFQCGKLCKPDGHHHDYNRPLDVEWLCRACHSRRSPRTVNVLS